MASIAFKNVDGSTLSRVRIMKDGRALETFPVTPGTPMRTWPSMDAWAQELPREWPRVEAWTRVPLTLTREKARRLYYTKQKQKAVVAGPALAYFLKLPEGGMTNREEVREALASYMDFYKWGMSVHRAKRDVKPANPLYHLDDFLVTLTRLDPRGTYTARQILNAVLAWQTWTAPAVAPAVDEETPLVPLVPLEETPLGSLGPLEETPLGPQEETPLGSLGPQEETPSAEDLAWHILRIMGENKRLKAEIEALQARLCTIRAAASI
jgi:hypothetical protein